MSGPSHSRATTVLIVDGEARSSQRLAKLLREDGFEVEVLRDGSSALDRISHSPPVDALITELSLPASDGAALARFASAHHPNMTIIVLTRHPNLLDVTKFGENLPLVLTKPLDYAQLLEVLGAPPHAPSGGVHVASPRF